MTATSSAPVRGGAAVPATGLAVVRTHLDRLRGRFGIFQHAHGLRPAPEHGFCVDDIARALSVDLRHELRLPSRSTREAIRDDLAQIEAAFDHGTGRFRNLRAADGTWLDDIGSEDCHGRAILALGDTIRLSRDADVRARAAELLVRALPAVGSLRGLRPLAYTILGCTTVVEMRGTDRCADTCRDVALAMAERLAGEPGWDDGGWPWPDDIVTYDAPSIAAALIGVGRWSGTSAWTELGLRTLHWLADAEVSMSGSFQPIGNHGWWPRGGRPATDDAQPIEAASMIMAASEAWRATGDEGWLRVARSAWGWFLGANAAGLMVADPPDGSCHDGLGPDGLNHNRGAESTLAWLASVEAMADLGSALIGERAPRQPRPRLRLVDHPMRAGGR
jgi:hypothetical protein